MAKDWKYRFKREKEKEVFKEFDDWSREDLMEYIIQLRSGLKEMEEIAKNPGSNTSVAAQKVLTEADYKQNWSYPTKIAFLITMHNKPLTSEELEKHLIKLDSHYKDYNNPRNNLTVTLSRAIKSRRIAKVKVPGIRSLYYVLPEWLDRDGELRAHFRSVYNTFQ